MLGMGGAQGGGYGARCAVPGAGQPEQQAVLQQEQLAEEQEEGVGLKAVRGRR